MQRDKLGVLEGFDHAYEDDVTDKKVCRPSIASPASSSRFEDNGLTLVIEPTVSLYSLGYPWTSLLWLLLSCMLI